MSDDKIAEIRKRTTFANENKSVIRPTGFSWTIPGWQAHNDRAFLLSEVERQRAEIERLFNEDTKTRHALKGWVFVCPDGGDEPTHERVAAVVAEIERLRAMLPPTAHSGVRSGPGEGSWSVFAGKVVEERDAARAEIERLRADLALEKSRIVLQRGEIERLRAENERLRTVYVLIASREAGPVDSATCWYEDKIIGCYISREAAEETAKLLMADWRINEYALVGKP